jgi:hypothetical protein
MSKSKALNKSLEKKFKDVAIFFKVFVAFA